MKSAIDVYKTDRLRLDFSELTSHYSAEDLKRLNQLKNLIEEMVV